MYLRKLRSPTAYAEFIELAGGFFAVATSNLIEICPRTGPHKSGCPTDSHVNAKPSNQSRIQRPRAMRSKGIRIRIEKDTDDVEHMGTWAVGKAIKAS